MCNNRDKINLKEPPKAIFTHRPIKSCYLEKPRLKLNQSWLDELNQVEERIKKFISMDIEKLGTICTDPGDMERLCKVLELEEPLGPLGEDKKFSLYKFPEMPFSRTRVSTKSRKSRKSRIAESIKAELEGEEEEEGPSSSETDDLEDESFRKTLLQSVIGRATEERHPISRFWIDLSEESEVSEKSRVTSSDASSDNKSLETIGYLSDDLFVNPAGSQNTELLEPLEDFRSPYQKFFSKSHKEIREHIERLRKKIFRNNTERSVEEFLTFLRENDLETKNTTFENLMHLFSIDIETPGERAFCLDPKELPSVPKEIANLFNEPHCSTRAVLHQQIMWDVIYEKGKEKKLAFGRSLPKPRRQWKRNTQDKWFQLSNVDWELLTGKDLWENLLNTEIMESFGTWLLENPQYDRPEYLVQSGYFKHLKEKIVKETEPITLPVKNKGELTKIMKTLASRPLALDTDEDKFKHLPRYKEVLEARLHRAITYEGIEIFDGKKLDL